MNILGIFSSQNFIKSYFKMHSFAPFKKILGGTRPNSPTSACRGTCNSPKLENKLGPLENTVYAIWALKQNTT